MFKIPSARVKLHTKGQVFTSGEKSVQLLEMIHRALPGPSQMFYMAIIETWITCNFSQPLLNILRPILHEVFTLA